VAPYCDFFCLSLSSLPVTAVQTDSATERLMFAFQGTVIRVFSVPDGQKLFEFRRGVKRFAHILCILENLLFYITLPRFDFVVH